jgi:hypothetical protein
LKARRHRSADLPGGGAGLHFRRKLPMKRSLMPTAAMTAIALGLLTQHADAQATNTAKTRSGLGAAQVQCVPGYYSGGIEPSPIMFAPSGINTAEGIGALPANFNSILMQPGLYLVL